MPSSKVLKNLEAHWQSKWQEALSKWSNYTIMQSPVFCFTVHEEQMEYLTGSFAMIRLVDHRIVISLRQIASLGLERFPVEIIAHEIGHHVFCPADLSDHAKMLSRIRLGLPGMEDKAPMIANIYSDLLINDRLQRQEELDMSGVFITLNESDNGEGSAVWKLYMRLYEILWGLQSGTLVKGTVSPSMEGDARLGAKLVRVYGKYWLEGAGRFAALIFPYLQEDAEKSNNPPFDVWLDTTQAGLGGNISGLTTIENSELSSVLHPALDPSLNDYLETNATIQVIHGEQEETIGGKKTDKNYRTPIQYNELLNQLGIKISQVESVLKYYRECALPYLIKYPEITSRVGKDEQLEGLETWDLGNPLHSVDWLESVINSPFIIPGATTLQRHHGEIEGDLSKTRPLDLYIGIDCSGSMPNPKYLLSFPALAGTIVALSALRAGANVKCVLSGEPGKSTATKDFVNNEKDILEVLTSYLGTGFAFGIHRLEETYTTDRQRTNPSHILIITDSDIFSMLEIESSSGGFKAPKTNRGWKVASEALEIAKGGGTFVLNMPSKWRMDEVDKLRKKGWNVFLLNSWEELTDFARDFSKDLYEKARETL